LYVILFCLFAPPFLFSPFSFSFSFVLFISYYLISSLSLNVAALSIYPFYIYPNFVLSKENASTEESPFWNVSIPDLSKRLVELGHLPCKYFWILHSNL